VTLKCVIAEKGGIFMADILNFPRKNIHIAVSLAQKAREIQDSDRDVALHLFQEAVRYFLMDGLTSRGRIKYLRKANHILSAKLKEVT
tara:strand:+ start:52 stop:315 length:264 start_codon:yes stop_codon:yes gene_type:complete